MSPPAADDDDFRATSVSFQGRTTGMGNLDEAATASEAVGEPAPRKRLRRGAAGASGAEDSAASSQFTSELATPAAGDSPAPNGAEQNNHDEQAPGFTASLQNRLADFNVDSGPPSSASSAYGGGGGSSAPMQSNGSNEGTSQPQQTPAGRQQQPQLAQVQQAGGRPSPSYLAPQGNDYYSGMSASPSASASVSPAQQHRQVYGGAPPAGAPAPGIDSSFDRFYQTVGTNFSRDHAYVAWCQSGRSQMEAISLLVKARPTGPSPTTTNAGAGYPNAYSQVNSPLVSTPTHYSQQQLSHGRAPIQVMTRPAQATPQGMMSSYRPVPPQARPNQPGPFYAANQQHATPYAASPVQQQQQQPQSAPQPNLVAMLPPEHQDNYYRLVAKQQSGLVTDQDRAALAQYHAHLNTLRAKYQPPQQQGYRQGQQAYQNGSPAGAVPHQQMYGRQQYPGQSHFAVQGRYAPPAQHSQQQRYQQPQQYSQQRPVRTYQAPQTSGSILARQLAAAAGSAPKKKRKRAAQSESEDDGGAYDSGGSGDEYGVTETPAMIIKRETLATEFFNTCEKEMLMELAGANATQATLTMKLRPFANAADFRTRTRKQKGVGNMMMETYLDVVRGMGEVDKVLNNCERIGQQLSSVMRIWQSGAASTDPNVGMNTASDVGLNIVAISDEVYEQRVVPSQNPEVQAAFQGYLRKKPEGVPDSVTLKDYQMLGVNWLNLLWNRRTSCILADEMGLGKTIQVIALLAHIKATDQPGPHLVVVPSSTLENWIREFSVFAPGLKVETYYGSQSERADIRHELRQMTDLDVVVTTYNIATSSPEDQKFLKKKMDFKVTVFDEGHQLKNSESKKYKDLMQIKAQWRLLLTGTPLQNNLQELVSLLSFILPDQFRDASDSLRAIFKVQPGQSANLLSRERVSRAKKMMTPFVLRRKKAQVLKDLPSKHERIEWCDMTELQRTVYEEALMRSKKALLQADKDEIEELGSEDESGAELLPEDEKPKPKPKGRKKKGTASTKTGNKADASSSTHVLTDLRKMSLCFRALYHRSIYTEKMLREMARDCLKELEFVDRDKNLIFEDMEVMTDFELHRFCLGYKHLEKYALKEDEWMSAGKIHKLKEQLPKMKADGDRVLLFSQFTQVLDILEVVLDTMGIKYIKLTGQTNVTERQGLCDLYNNEPEITVFLLSTRAGGLGLNLTAANTVIFYDQDYNPHNDKQAEDRAYRIGQKRDVTIIKYITKGSLEEDMRRLATNKLKLDSEVSGQSDAAVDTDENNSHQVEKKVRTSLLSNLKMRFEGETQGSTQQEGTAKKEEA